MGVNASNSPWTPELQERVIELAGKGLGQSAIARELGITKNQVCGWLDRRSRGERAGIPSWMTQACNYDGPTTDDRLKALHDKMDAVLAEAAAAKKYRGESDV